MPWLYDYQFCYLKFIECQQSTRHRYNTELYSLYVVDYIIYIDFLKITLKQVFTELQTKVTTLEISKFLSSEEHLFMNEREGYVEHVREHFNSITWKVHIILLDSSIKL